MKTFLLAFLFLCFTAATMPAVAQDPPNQALSSRREPAHNHHGHS